MEKELPKNWILTELGEIAAWGSGGTPSRGNKLYYNGTIPWIKTGELKDTIISDTNEKITELALKNSSAKLFPKGSVAIAMYGATIGKTGLLGIDASTNQACAIAQTYSGISNKYLHYYLISERQNFINKGKGGAQPNISQTIIKKHDFPLAPLNEQSRIVNRLDQLYSHLDKLKVRLETIPELLKQFKEAVLTRAVTGKLTEEWRSKVNNKYKIQSLLEQISSEKDDLVQQKIIRHEIESDETKQIPFHIPSTWKWTKLIKLSKVITQGPNPKLKGIPNEKYRIIKTKDFYDRIIHYRSAGTISKECFDEFSRFELQENDIIFGLVGVGSTGKCNIFRSQNNIKYIFTRATGLFRLINTDLFLPEIIKYYLISEVGTEQIENITGGTTGQLVIKTSSLKNLLIPAMPIEEQKEIVKRVEALFAKCDRIENQYYDLKEQIDDLPQTILAKAFRGGLVSQDADDEPAEVLLERIKVLKKSLPKNQRISKK